MTRLRARDVDKGGGARGATAPPPLGAIFALKYLKKEGEIRQKLAETVNPHPPLRAKVKSAPPLEGMVSTCLLRAEVFRSQCKIVIDFSDRQ